MKPSSRRNLSQEELILNYRLSRARRTVENAFGILANRFRVFLSHVPLTPENTVKVTLATCALHNYLRTNSMARYMNTGSIDRENDDGTITPGDWRFGETMRPLSQQGSNTYCRGAKEVRDEYCKYFNEEGRVSWQDKLVNL